MLEDVRLLVTELITNALRHGSLTPGDRVSVKASVDRGVVRLEVTDPGRDGEVAPRDPGPRGGGYGLYPGRAARAALGRRSPRRHHRLVRARTGPVSLDSATASHQGF